MISKAIKKRILKFGHHSNYDQSNNGCLIGPTNTINILHHSLVDD